ncbi:uncharacterized protein BXZ73DRAFT_49234 [Epithele typhae]|uniref:uncharacterized protein n=1 Tax=Epithele typhae TaxID=378194 RepID=UPI002008726D|nr:uncharacterized protein BXZ73DRAFT_49234 [Epithele typhae]KAH9926651.1 hypothetical protein BXZ73DRAFT_49234 [Epithele typhae]
MDRVPPDVLDIIFAAACNDGGFTGSSLSLVSRHVRECVRSSRFRTVMLDRFKNRNALEVFTSCFLAERARPAHHRPPRVRHLYLTSGRRRGAPQCHEVRAANKLAAPPVLTLLRLVAPDLLSLVLVDMEPSDWRLGVPLPSAIGSSCLFPVLQDLTIIGGHLHFAPLPLPSDEAAAVAVAQWPVFPRLRRLRVTSDVGSQNMRTWAARAPKLEHVVLEFAGISAEEALRVLREFEGVVGTSPHVSSSVVWITDYSLVMCSRHHCVPCGERGSSARVSQDTRDAAFPLPFSTFEPSAGAVHVGREDGNAAKVRHGA